MPVGGASILCVIALGTTVAILDTTTLFTRTRNPAWLNAVVGALNALLLLRVLVLLLVAHSLGTGVGENAAQRRELRTHYRDLQLLALVNEFQTALVLLYVMRAVAPTPAFYGQPQGDVDNWRGGLVIGVFVLFLAQLSGTAAAMLEKLNERAERKDALPPNDRDAAQE